MRLELGHVESVAEQALALLDAMEARVLALSALSADEVAQASRALADDTATLRMYCVSLRSQGDLVETLKDAEGFLNHYSTATVIDERVGGLLMHLVATCRHALASGTSQRVAERLPKILSDLRRVMSNLKSRPAPAPSQPQAVAEAANEDDQYRDLFFSDPSLAQLQALVSKIDADAAAFDAATATELFRVLHTIKGNAAMIGYSEVMGYAHAVEDVLALVCEGELACSNDVARFLVDCGQRLRVLLERRKSRHGLAGSVSDVTGWVAEIAAYVTSQAQISVEHIAPVQPIRLAPSKPRPKPAPLASEGFFLKVFLGGRELTIPCGSISSVLRHQQVLALPGGREGWAGLIRCSGALVPLVEPSTLIEGARAAETEASEAAWVVVLKLAQGQVAVPVDEVREVVEVPYEFGSSAVIDFAKIKIWD